MIVMTTTGGTVRFREAGHLSPPIVLTTRPQNGRVSATASHIGNDPNVDRYDPDLWTDEFAFLSQPRQADIQSDMFYDYRTNVDAYPKWQDWMRHRQPHLLVIWGKHDPSFDISEPEAYRRDVPQAEVHVLDAGHFALDAAANEIAILIRNFLGTSR
jgi:pimeloyl-ACP methyl ester carboxylesterase